MSNLKREIRERWTRPPWAGYSSQVLDGLRRFTLPTELGFPLHDGRLDMRGLTLPKPDRKDGFTFSARSLGSAYDVAMHGTKLGLRDAALERIDLSLSNIAQTEWTSCVFRDDCFARADIRNVYFTTCRFEDVSFEKADLRESTMGGYFGTGPNVYRRVSFAGADLRETSHRHSLFEDCDFSHARLDGVDFSGSRFVRCKFAGRLAEVWFRGWYANASSDDLEYFRRTGLDEKALRNPMEDIDFTNSELWDVQFVDGIDLSRCRFPKDGDHITVFDKKTVYDRVKAAVERDWPAGRDQEEALDLLDLLVGSGYRHQRKTEEKLRQTYRGSELERYLAMVERSYATGRAQNMTVINRKAAERGDGFWAKKLLDVLAAVAQDVRP